MVDSPAGRRDRPRSHRGARAPAGACGWWPRAWRPPSQRAALVELGCTAAQGYHFFKPMPADKIVTVLAELLDEAQAQIFPLRDSDAS